MECLDKCVGSASGVTGFLGEISDGTSLTLGDIVKRLEETYCNTIGVVRWM